MSLQPVVKHCCYALTLLFFVLNNSCPCFILQSLPPPSTRPSQSFSSCAKCWTSTTLTSSLALSRTRTGSNSPKKSKVKMGVCLHVRKRELQRNKKCITCVGVRERDFKQEQGEHMSQPFKRRHILNATPTLYIIHQV